MRQTRTCQLLKKRAAFLRCVREKYASVCTDTHIFITEVYGAVFWGLIACNTPPKDQTELTIYIAEKMAQWCDFVFSPPHIEFLSDFPVHYTVQ